MENMSKEKYNCWIEEDDFSITIYSKRNIWGKERMGDFTHGRKLNQNQAEQLILDNIEQLLLVRDKINGFLEKRRIMAL